MDSMQIRVARPAFLLALALAAPLGGCEVFRDVAEEIGLSENGYTKVTHRVRAPVESHGWPEPPPYVAGFGAGAAEVPLLAAAATPPGVSQEMVEQGAQLYGTVCSACHGPGGAGSALGPQLSDDAWLHISGEYDEIVGTIQTGVPNPIEFASPMPPLGGGSFNTEEVRALAAYVFALSHAEPS
jgi:mono/diheme cytochrome c family protein